MDILVDASVIGRLSNTRDPEFNTAQLALRKLEARGARLHITAQVMIEFRNFGTRPASANGLGLSARVWA